MSTAIRLQLSQRLLVAAVQACKQSQNLHKTVTASGCALVKPIIYDGASLSNAKLSLGGREHRSSQQGLQFDGLTSSSVG